jgi:hypothetical protein
LRKQLSIIPHVCNQDYRPYSALEWAALSSLNSIEIYNLEKAEKRVKDELFKKRKLDKHNDSSHEIENEFLKEQLATIVAAKLAVKSANEVLAVVNAALTFDGRIYAKKSIHIDSSEHCSYIDDDMIQNDSDNEEIGNEHCAYIDDDMIQYDFTNEEIGNEHCAYIDDDMIQYYCDM